LLLQLKPRLP
jgi:hypothetical protein